MMKSGILILAAIGVLCGEATAIDLLTRGFALGSRSTPPSCDGMYGFMCHNCTHIKLCAKTEVTVQACSTVSPLAPYCQQNSCTADATASNGETCTPHFDCMGAGAYPDLTDCTRYFLCDKAGGDAEMFQCPPVRVYSSKMEGCKLKKVPADCETVNCSKTPGSFLVLKSDPSVLAVCPTDGGSPYVLRCRDSVYSEYDPKTLSCNFRCPAEGRYPDRLNCKKFYECYKSGTTLNFMHQDCGEKFAYDKAEKKCVLGTCTSDVPAETPANPTPDPDPNPDPNPDTIASQGSLPKIS